MYNFSGIYYQIKSECVFLLIAGIIFFLFSKFWNPFKRNMKDILMGGIAILLSLILVIYYMNAIENSCVLIHEGNFVDEHRASVNLLMMEYSFSNGDEEKPVFYLDVLSKKEIYPDDFEEEIRYRIYYEEKTNMIVKVEVLE